MFRKKFLATVGGGVIAAGSPSSPGATSAAVTATRLSAMPTKLADLIRLEHVEKLAEKVMPSAVHDYIAGGAAAELTIRWNTEKYRDLRLQPKANHRSVRWD